MDPITASVIVGSTALLITAPVVVPVAFVVSTAISIPCALVAGIAGLF